MLKKRLFLPRWLKLTLLFLFSFMLIIFLLQKILDKPIPTGQEGPAAEALADKLLLAIGEEYWQNTQAVKWTFAGVHHYLWDKKRHYVEVRWNEKRVLLNPNTLTGVAWEGDKPLEANDLSAAVTTAWEYFTNDAFWLNAPAKIRDPGTRRAIVKLENGKEALLVTYASGGVTPGDSYLWLLDEDFLPYAWRMWVKIIPVGGVESSWEGWQTLQTGAKVATKHQTSFLNIEISNLEGAASLEALIDSQTDPFLPLLDTASQE